MIRTTSLLAFLVTLATSASARAQDVVPFYSEAFEDAAPGTRIGQYDPPSSTFRWGVSGNVTFTDEVARTGGQALRFHVKAGPQYNNEARFFLGRNVAPSVWMEFYIYYPDGNEGIANVARYVHGNDPDSGDNDKFIRLWAENYNRSIGLHTDPAGPRDEDESIQFTWKPNDNVAGSFHPDGYTKFSRMWIEGNSDRGRWIQVRIEFRADTLGTLSDGRYEGSGGLRLWKDGVLVNELVSCNFADDMEPYFSRGYFLGAANSGSPVNTAVYIDDLKVYDQDPGWASEGRSIRGDRRR